MSFKERFIAKVIQQGQTKNLVFTGGGVHLRQRISILPEGKEVFVTIETAHAKRSLAQNNLYWLYIGIISDETGNDKESLHELFKRKFLFKGMKIVKVGDKKYEVPIVSNSSELNKGEFVEYMLNIEAETEIPIPNVEEWKELVGAL